MGLEIGSRLGHYDVTALIGEGGMGQVYQATDTKLNRQVALKILPEAFASDPDRLARFQREAQVLASLNHPGIAQIYGIEEADDTRALVLELVEGPTLADRIAQGPIPVDEALPIATQIAEALEAAHEQGIIHRDLKPANIKLKPYGTVKVLDFGLAKALETTSGVDPSESPTLTAAGTRMGVIMGTAAYMSPEQAQGRTVDRRADVWAFGAVLYEMLVGRRAFVGGTVSDTFVSVLRDDPDWSALHDDVPARVRQAIQVCLRKDPKQRVRDTSAIRLAMEGAFETTGATRAEPIAARQLQVWQRPVPVSVALLVAALVAGVGVWAVMRANVIPTGLVRFAIAIPDTAPLGTWAFQDLVISPDGTQVVYAGLDPSGSGPQLYVRPIDQFVGAPLRGGEGGQAPFLSPNGEWVGFLDASGRMIRRVSIFGGPPVTLAESPSSIVGASWGGDDQIVFGTNRHGLFRVSAGGGEPEALTTLDTEQDEFNHTWPTILPNRGAVVFVINSDLPDPDDEFLLAVLDLDTGDVTKLGLQGVSPHYVSTGHLVYAARDQSVRAVPFDATSLEVRGTPVTLVEDVVVKFSGAAQFSISDDGRLVYVLDDANSGGQNFLVWFDHEGQLQRLELPPDRYFNTRLSPDGTQVAMGIGGENNDIWVSDVERNTLSTLTTHAAQDAYPMWADDGQRIVYQSTREGDDGLFSRAADGTGVVQRLVIFEEGRVSLWGRPLDAGRLVFSYGNPSGSGSVGLLSLEGEPSWEPVLNSEGVVLFATVSPDSRWIAYASTETGDPEIYVQRFPDGGQKQRISSDRGVKPLWSPDGDALYYAWGNTMMVVPVTMEPTFTPGTPTVLFEAADPLGGRSVGVQDISPDGQRFLAIIREGSSGEDAPPPPIYVVLNWFEELTERVPSP